MIALIQRMNQGLLRIKMSSMIGETLEIVVEVRNVIQDSPTRITLRIEEGRDRCEMHNMADIINYTQLKTTIPPGSKMEDWWDESTTDIWTG